MKIELKYDGKIYYDSLFKFMWNNEQTNFAIGIKYQNDIDYTFIRKDLLDITKNLKLLAALFIIIQKKMFMYLI